MEEKKAFNVYLNAERGFVSIGEGDGEEGDGEEGDELDNLIENLSLC